MTDISDISGKGLPSSASLLRATGIALVVAGVVLVTAVLPAEYAIDPTGIGKRLGLTALSHASAGLTSGSPAGPVWQSSTPIRSDDMSLTLAPGKGAEIKALMQSGEGLQFSWTANGGPVYVDMHGEKPDARKGEFTSYRKDREATRDTGTFVSPFAGSHGWFWKNRGSNPVTITVHTSGYYEKLYRP